MVFSRNFLPSGWHLTNSTFFKSPCNLCRSSVHGTRVPSWIEQFPYRSRASGERNSRCHILKCKISPLKPLSITAPEALRDWPTVRWLKNERPVLAVTWPMCPASPSTKTDHWPVATFHLNSMWCQFESAKTLVELYSLRMQHESIRDAYIVRIKDGFMVSVRPCSYGCAQEVAKHERSVGIASCGSSVSRAY